MRYNILNNDDGGPIVYWGIGQHDRNSAEIVPLIKGMTGGAPFTLVAFLAEDWNADFSPWTAPAVFGNEAFGGKGPETLKWLTDVCIPSVEGSGSSVERFITGYSLAGLFSLWAALSTCLFDGVASCSGSLWFPNWIDFARTANVAHTMDIYLSLGDTEERTKNAVMSTVGDRTRETYDILASKNGEANHIILEWNKGGHFSEPTMRTAKSIAWLINQKNK